MTATDSLIMKRPLQVFFGALLLALVSACGDDQQSGQQQETATSDSDMTEQAPAQPEPETGAAESAAEPGMGADSGSMADETADGAAADSGNNQGGGNSHTVTARSTAFDPVVVKIKPGDSVNWTNMSGHNVHFEKGNIPDGVEPYQSPLGDNINRTFDKEGLYLYKCDPHFAMGMVGAIIVGEPGNVAQVEENAKGMYKRALAKAKKEIP